MGRAAFHPFAVDVVFDFSDLVHGASSSGWLVSIVTFLMNLSHYLVLFWVHTNPEMGDCQSISWLFYGYVKQLIEL